MGYTPYYADGWNNNQTGDTTPITAAALNNMEDGICQANNIPHNYAYDGANLKTVFETAEALHTALAAGDFSKIRVGDYWPLEISGTVKDFASNTDKTLNETVNMEVAGIDVYAGYKPGGNLSQNFSHHLIMLSRDCLQGIKAKMRSDASTWYDSTKNNPWRGSALYQTLNDPDYGLLKIVLDGELGDYVYTNGSNNLGMAISAESKSNGDTSAEGITYLSRGPLFLPLEQEIWGKNILGESILTSLPQWPLFVGSTRRAAKVVPSSPVGSANSWRLQDSEAGSATGFCGVRGGDPYWTPAGAICGIVLCFLLV